jgi:hypothetical protein
LNQKPASDGRIKTNRFFSFKPVEDALARTDLRFFGWGQWERGDYQQRFDGPELREAQL